MSRIIVRREYLLPAYFGDGLILEIRMIVRHGSTLQQIQFIPGDHMVLIPVQVAVNAMDVRGEEAGEGVVIEVCLV